MSKPGCSAGNSRACSTPISTPRSVRRSASGGTVTRNPASRANRSWRKLLCDHVVEVAVGRGDHAEIDLDGARAADRHDLALLQHAEQCGLRARRQVADLVEEQRAAVRRADQAGVVGLRAAERALLVAEQLALDEVLGQRAAVDRHERAVAAGLRRGSRGRSLPCRCRSRPRSASGSPTTRSGAGR